MTPSTRTPASRHATVAVIIPTVGRDTLDACLQSIHSQTRKADEVIVVHDCERKGAAETRNEGIARSTSEYLAFTDD
jgi:glycosyltransferase involved in cell wall biosynthesis